MKLTWKRFLAIGLAALMTTACLTGCGSSNGSSSSSSGSSSDSKKEVTLSFGIWDKNQEPTMQALCDAYTKENPNVKFDIQLTPYKGAEYWTKLEASLNGGTAPDVFWMNSLHVEKYVDGGMLEPLDKTIKSENFDTTQFPDSLNELFTVKSSQYAIPKDFDTNALWYNKEIFDKAGVAYPTDDWTWDDMVAAAKKLNDPANNIYGIAAPLDSQTCYYNTVFACGGYILNKDKTGFGYDQAGTVEGIQCWVDLINQGLSPTVDQTTETSADAMFEAGNLAMVWAGSYMTPEYTSNDVIKDKINLVEAPAYKGTKANVINGLGYAVYSKSKHKSEALKFALWLGGEEAMTIQGKSGVVISARNDTQELFAQTHSELNLKAYTNQAQLATQFPGCTVSSELIDLENKYLKQAFAGEITVKKACDTLQKEATALLS